MDNEAIQEFTVDILSSCPLAGPPRPDAAGNAPESVERHPIGVLVIEDQKLMLKAMEQGLRKRGFLVWTASDGAEGVDVYSRFKSHIDVVLSDVQMPVLDGPMTLDRLRHMDPAVRFCFMTGDTRTTTLANLLDRGAMRVFTKPFSSVAAVADELWGLATQPSNFSAGSLLTDCKATGLNNKPASIPLEEMPAGGRFLGCASNSFLWLAACVGLLLGKR